MPDSLLHARQSGEIWGLCFRNLGVFDKLFLVKKFGANWDQAFGIKATSSMTIANSQFPFDTMSANMGRIQNSRFNRLGPSI